MQDKRFLKYTIYADFYRAFGDKISKKQILKLFFGLSNPGPKYILYMRVANYLYKRNSKILLKLLTIHLNRRLFRYGVEIGYKTQIREGLSIPHFNSIVIGERAVIGRNCTILQGVTIGANLFKDRYEVATIGDNVVIGSGAKIIGPIKIGNNVTIGANSVVTKDIPDNVVVAGAPAKVISNKPAIEIGTDYMRYEEFK